MTPYALEIFNMTLPPEGPAAVPIVIDFDGSFTTSEIDLTQQINDGVISYVAGVSIDTLEATDGSIRVINNVSGQRVEGDAGGVTIMPLYAPNPPKFVIEAFNGYTGIVRLHFLNFPVWPFTDIGGDGTIAGPLGLGASEIAVATAPSGMPFSVVGSNATDQTLGTGVPGEFISHLILQPISTSPGVAILNDGGFDVFNFPGGASSILSLAPIIVPIGIVAVNGWTITTGADMFVTVVGLATP